MPLQNKPSLYEFINFHSGSIREFPNVSRPETRWEDRMPVLSRDREEDVPTCAGREISQFFLGKSGSREMAFVV